MAVAAIATWIFERRINKWRAIEKVKGGSVSERIVVKFRREMPEPRLLGASASQCEA
jgi:hypothetical protein